MALKSNSKAVIEKVRAYIAENTEPEIVEAIEWENEHHGEEITAKARELYEAGKVYEASALYILQNWKERRNPNSPRNLQDNFLDWLRGLPLNIADDIILHGAGELVGGWLEQTAEEVAKYEESESEALASYLVYREITKTAHKFNYNYY